MGAYFLLCAINFGFLIFLVSLLFSQKLRTATRTVFQMPHPQSNEKLTVLDSFRGIAAFVIVASHLWQWHIPFHDNIFPPFFMAMIKGQGSKTVALFFVLSGFLIYRTILKCVTMDDLRVFAFRRLIRIYPAYVACLVCTFVMKALLLQDHSTDFVQFISELFMMKVFFYQRFSMPVAWSIYVEEVLYMVIPIWISLFRKIPRIASITLFTILIFLGDDGDRELALMKYFIAGIIFSHIWDYFKNKNVNSYVSLSLFGLALWLFYQDIFSEGVMQTAVAKISSTLFSHKLTLYKENTVDFAFSTVLLFFSVLKNPVLNRLFSFAPLQFLGTISYSFFLWHQIVLSYFGGIMMFPDRGANLIYQHFGAYSYFLCLFGSIAVGAVSFLFIERPWLLWRERTYRMKRAPLPLTIKDLVPA